MQRCRLRLLYGDVSQPPRLKCAYRANSVSVSGTSYALSLRNARKDLVSGTRTTWMVSTRCTLCRRDQLFLTSTVPPLHIIDCSNLQHLLSASLATSTCLPLTLVHPHHSICCSTPASKHQRPQHLASLGDTSSCPRFAERSLHFISL